MVYSRQQLIDEWKMRSGLEPARIDATLRRYDALDVDAYVAMLLDDWYIKMLDEGDITQLDPEDITEDVTVESMKDGVAVIALPPGTRRLIEVTDNSWKRPAIITAAGSALARRQESVFGRGRCDSPVAVVDSRGQARLYSYQPGVNPAFQRVMAVRYEPDVYRLDPSALSQIPLTLTHIP